MKRSVPIYRILHRAPSYVTHCAIIRIHRRLPFYPLLNRNATPYKNQPCYGNRDKGYVLFISGGILVIHCAPAQHVCPFITLNGTETLLTLLITKVCLIRLRRCFTVASMIFLQLCASSIIRLVSTMKEDTITCFMYELSS